MQIGGARSVDIDINLTNLLFRWMHILPAIIAVGGSIFMRAALLPAVTGLSDSERPKFHEAVRSRWSKWVAGAILFLLVSGFYNFFYNTRTYKLPPVYQMLFGVKFLLALGVFALASILSGRSGLAQRLRQTPRPWLNLNVTMAVLVVLISGAMRGIPHTQREGANPPAQADAK
jgi:uncharacterized membrane protein